MREPLALESLRRVLEQFERMPPPVVLEVSPYMPDDMILDYTAMEQQAEQWSLDQGWRVPAKRRPHEQRLMLSEGTLRQLRQQHPELFSGPFAIPVFYRHPDASDAPPAS